MPANLYWIEAKKATIERMVPHLRKDGVRVKRLNGEDVQDMGAEYAFQSRRLDLLEWAKGEMPEKALSKANARSGLQAARDFREAKEQAKAAKGGAKADDGEDPEAIVTAAERAVANADDAYDAEAVRMESFIKVKIRELASNLTPAERLQICGDVRGWMPDKVEAVAHIEDLLIALGKHPATDPEVDLYAVLVELGVIVDG